MQSYDVFSMLWFHKLRHSFYFLHKIVIKRVPRCLHQWPSVSIFDIFVKSFFYI